ncbi:MAG: hypothetical protein SFX72_18935 [Isosphaeraceae bacterium]|nr:hypothetical protein [Isosphaeraceae bacterium]
MITRRSFHRAALAAPLAVAAGCVPLGRVDLIVLTGWNRAARDAFRRNLVDSPARDLEIRWIETSPVDSPAVFEHLVARADVVVGLPERIVRGRLPGLDLVSLGTRRVGFATGSDLPFDPSWAAAAMRSSDRRESLGFDDPRVDWPTQLAMSAQLERSDRSRGYAELVLAAANARPVEFGRGVAVSGVDRGVVGFAPALGIPGPISDAARFVAAEDAPAIREVAAVLPHAERSAAASALFDHLNSVGMLARIETPESPRSADVDHLIAELLGAALVEARPELQSATEALSRLELGPRRLDLLSFLVEPPSWPPASIRELAERETGSSLLETLAEQIAPDPRARDWFAAWSREPLAVFDLERLERLAAAAEGRLVRDPRFLAWLRAEWVAWVRQRYRRIARASRLAARE